MGDVERRSARWRRWPLGARRGRAVARERAQEMLSLPEGQLNDEERERLELLLDWLGRTEPKLSFPGGSKGVHATCVAEIDAIWSTMPSRLPRS